MSITPFSKYNKGGILFYVIVLILITIAVGIYVYIYRNPHYALFTDIDSKLAPAELLALPHVPTFLDTTDKSQFIVHPKGVRNLDFRNGRGVYHRPWDTQGLGTDVDVRPRYDKSPPHGTPTTDLETICKGIDHGQPMTDTAFLETMIPHHQVAVAVAKSINSVNQIIREFCRQIIWQQEYEITQMEAMVGRLPQPFSTARAKLRFTQSLYDFYNPHSLAMVSQPVCVPMHFQLTGHLPPNMPPMSDESFLKHMATHHATAVKMAKTQMRVTANSFIAALCYDLIHQQELELVKMNEMIANQAWATSVMLG